MAGSRAQVRIGLLIAVLGAGSFWAYSTVGNRSGSQTASADAVESSQPIVSVGTVRNKSVTQLTVEGDSGSWIFAMDAATKVQTLATAAVTAQPGAVTDIHIGDRVSVMFDPSGAKPSVALSVLVLDAK